MSRPLRDDADGAPRAADIDSEAAAPAAVTALKQGLAGTLMLLAGASVVHTARTYGIGTLTAMGAGYFPALLGGALILLGAITLFMLLVVRLAAHRSTGSTGSTGSTVGSGTHAGLPSASPLGMTLRSIARQIEWRGGACILASIVSFVVLGQWAGLLPASFAVVFIAALGDRTNTVRGAAAIALVMTLISVVVFWWGLQLQMPLLRGFH